MMRRIIAATFALLPCYTPAHAQSTRAPDALLQRLETAKWRPSNLGSAKSLKDLYAKDFITVEYGADPSFTGVNRIIGAKKLMQAGGEDALIKALNQMTFDLSDWRFQHVSPTVVLVSYQVASPQFGSSRLWATSVWRHAAGRWETTFYQASKAR